MEALGVHGSLIGDALLDDYYPGKRSAQILAGVERPKKAAKPKGKTGSAADAAQAPTVVPATKERISTPRKDQVQLGAKDAQGKPSSRTTPANPAQKGVKEPPMAESTNMVVPTETPAAKKPAKKAAPKKKAAAKKAAPKKKAAAPAEAPAEEAAAEKPAPKKKAPAQKKAEEA
ncbi:hypothetical protein OY671_008243 [Metschnikowia pulcherrima]|nr:hypothetical protein OY671_008243 [Metschnikowia pulcherrima]